MGSIDQVDVTDSQSNCTDSEFDEFAQSRPPSTAPSGSNELNLQTVKRFYIPGKHSFFNTYFSYLLSYVLLSHKCIFSAVFNLPIFPIFENREL